jgi:gastric triacylglycerol lipase
MDDRFNHFKEIVEEHNMTAENYEVTTDDGYILSLNRIKAKENNTKVILMMHGLSSDSLMWLVNDFDKAPAFMLAQ